MTIPASTSTAQHPLALDRTVPLHFVGVGGIGMSGLAKILLESGFQVSGSDLAQNKQTEQLSSLGGKIFQGHQASQVPANAVLIVSSSISSVANCEKNPEVKQALDRGQAIYHRSDLLREILQGTLLGHQTTIGISGTHGKTSITGMTGLALAAAGLDPTVVVGGNIPEWQTNAKLSANRQFGVAELDESDGSILQYTPDITVISNLELDHADHYHDGLKEIITTFQTFLSKLKPGSSVLYNLDCPTTKALADTAPKGLKKIFLSVNDLSTSEIFPPQLLFETAHADVLYWLKNVRHHGHGSYQGYVYKQDKTRAQLLGELHLTVPGLHNLFNALAAIAVGDQADGDFDEMTAALRQFSGMGRRFEKVGELPLENSATAKLFDDYAHHPTEVKATLKAAKDMAKSSGSRVIAVFQPHRYSRLSALWDEFCTCFGDADQVVIADVYAAHEPPIAGVTAEAFAQAIAKTHANAQHIPSANADFDAIRAYLKTAAQPGDLILSMGAGSITHLLRNWG